MHELRASSSDRSQKKGDLLLNEPLVRGNGEEALIDVGITHPLIDTYLNNKSKGERGFAANKYAARKDKAYNEIFKKKNLKIDYHSFTMDTYGGFGTSTWNVINLLCDPSTHPLANEDYSPWNYPGPKRDFVLAIGFALQKGNAKMIRNADKRRRSARAAGKYGATGPAPFVSDSSGSDSQ